MRVLRAAAAALLLLAGLAPAVFAAGTQMSTAYPSVVADPGTTVKFPVVVTTDTPQRVDLTVTSQPQGWTTRLQGGGSTIAAVSTGPAAETTESPAPASNNFATFTAEVTVPADAAAGDQQVVLAGKATDGSTTQLTLDITIETGETGSVSMTTNFPSLTGPTSTGFKFSVLLHNDTNQQVTFGLSTDQPAGWTVTATPASETNAQSAVVDAGSNTTISVSASAPADTPAGAYKVTLHADGGPQPASIDLNVNITGTYSMSVSTSDQRLNADVTAGGTTTLTLVVTNDGSADIAGVKFTATPPRDWKVTFDPAEVDVAANSTANVTATITASDQALAGDYVITMTGRSADNSATDNITIRTTVSTSPIGYVIGIAILVLVGIGLFFVFQRYGRR